MRAQRESLSHVFYFERMTKIRDVKLARGAMQRSEEVSSGYFFFFFFPSSSSSSSSSYFSLFLSLTFSLPLRASCFGPPPSSLQETRSQCRACRNDCASVCDRLFHPLREQACLTCHLTLKLLLTLLLLMSEVQVLKKHHAPISEETESCHLAWLPLSFSLFLFFFLLCSLFVRSVGTAWSRHRRTGPRRLATSGNVGQNAPPALRSVLSPQRCDMGRPSTKRTAYRADEMPSSRNVVFFSADHRSVQSPSSIQCTSNVNEGIRTMRAGILTRSGEAPHGAQEVRHTPSWPPLFQSRQRCR